jgi:hypothetical protein
MDALIFFITVMYLLLSISELGDIPESLSATSYVWESKCSNKNTSKYLSAHYAHLFTIYCVIIAALLIYPWYTKELDYTRFMSIGGVLGILLAGVTPFFKSSWQQPVHYTGGILAMVCYVLWMGLNGYWVELVIPAGFACIATCIKKQPWVLYFELAGLLGLIVALF